MTIPDSERWLYCYAAAAAAGVPANTWRAYDRAGDRADAAVPIPLPRRCPVNGQKQWNLADIKAWKAARTAGRRGAWHGDETHRAILAVRAGRPRADKAMIAAQLGVHPRTVERHLTGQCKCRLDTSPAKG